ncbi:ribonuclease P protein component [Candidatus Gottesmanbacteria bacterium]|nr:ribonuclease P protein component [Candidatus Gottesmanbacteria bacterium]
MLPTSNRLPSSQIKSVMRHGKRIANAHLQCVFLPNHASMARFAFIVSTTVDKRATKRNRIKRVMRETVHGLLPRIGHYDVVLLARSIHEGAIVKSIHEFFGSL